MNAWLLVQGLETAALRMPAPRRERNKAVARVSARARRRSRGSRMPGLPDSPERERAARYLPRGAGAVFTFGLRGDAMPAERSSKRFELWSHSRKRRVTPRAW